MAFFLNKEKLYYYISGGLLTGWLLSCAFAAGETISHNYLHYQTSRLAVQSLQTHANKWVPVCLLLFCIGFAAYTGIYKALTAFLQRKTPGKSYNNFLPYSAGLILLACGIAGILFFLPDDTKQTQWIIAILCLVACSIYGDAAKRRAIKPTIVCLSLLILLIFLNGLVALDKRANRPDSPNIVLIIVDCLRADHLGFYGYQRPTSPAIDQLARSGLLFKRAYANAPWTKPSIASIFSSLYTTEHNVLNEANVLPSEINTLAEVLKNKGYKTFFFNGGNDFLEKDFNFHQGFDTCRYRSHQTTNADQVTGDFISEISQIDNDPFFAYIHYMDAHAPYTKTPINYLFTKNDNPNFEPGNRKSGFNKIRALLADNRLSTDDREHIIALYDAQIRFIDENIKAVTLFLNRSGLLENTILIITSDHGEEFWDHDNFEHGHSLYNELLHVPLIITGPDIPSRESTTPVQLIDIAPTIYHAVGIRKDTRLQGINLTDLPHNGPRDPQSPIFASGTLYGNEKYCTFEAGKKVIQNTDDGSNKWKLIGYTSPVEVEVYDIEKDPREHNNLIDAIPDTQQLLKPLQDLQNKSARFEEEVGTSMLDADLRDKLKALGYTQ